MLAPPRPAGGQRTRRKRREPRYGNRPQRPAGLGVAAHQLAHRPAQRACWPDGRRRVRRRSATPAAAARTARPTLRPRRVRPRPARRSAPAAGQPRPRVEADPDPGVEHRGGPPTPPGHHGWSPPPGLRGCQAVAGGPAPRWPRCPAQPGSAAHPADSDTRWHVRRAPGESPGPAPPGRAGSRTAHTPPTVAGLGRSRAG
jgi:hypothetical protein